MLRQSWVILVAAAAAILVSLVVLSRTDGELSVSDELFLWELGVIAVALERISASLTKRIDKLDERAAADREANAEARRTEAEARVAGDQAVTAALTELVTSEREARELALAEEREARQRVDEAMLAKITEWPEHCHEKRVACMERTQDRLGDIQIDQAEIRSLVNALVTHFIPEKADDVRLVTNGADSRSVPSHTALARNARRKPASSTKGGVGAEEPIEL